MFAVGKMEVGKMENDGSNGRRGRLLACDWTLDP